MKKFISVLIAAIMIFSVAGTSVFAEISPEGKKTYKVTIDYGIDIDENIVYDYIQHGDTITLTAKTKDNNNKYIFLRWSIEGEYEIISGSLTSPTLVIKPLGDIVIKQIVENHKDSVKDPDKKPQGGKNDSETSPPTNDNLLFILGGMLLTSLLATAVFGKLAK